MAPRLKAALTQQSHKSSEIRLWYAVLAQAITDASYLGIRKSYVDCKRQAINGCKVVQQISIWFVLMLI